MNNRVVVHGFDLLKAGNGDGRVIPIRMVANRMQRDRQGQTIDPAAFDAETVNRFINIGIIDWHHLSVLGETPEERAKSIIGKPTKFQWENDLPTVYGNLTAGNPIVRDAITPHLEADQPVLACSIGGKALLTKAEGGNGERIYKIYWDHLAIAGAPYVISSGSDVRMAKADRIFNYGNFGDLSDDIGRGGALYKALSANDTTTDSAELSGYPAVEGTARDRKTLEKIMAGWNSGEINDTEKGVRHYLKSILGWPATEIDNYMNGYFTKEIKRRTK